MPIAIEVTCSGPGCSAAIALAFEYATETFAHLVAALSESGWVVVVRDPIAGEGVAVGIQRRSHPYCPTHAAAVVAPPVAVYLEPDGARAPTPVAFERMVDIPGGAAASQPEIDARKDPRK